MSLKITGTCFKNADGLKYFRKGAMEVRLGSFGEKKEPVLEANYLQVAGTVKAQSLMKRKVEKSTTVTVDWSKTTWADVALDGKLRVFGLNLKIAGQYNYEKVKSAKCRLFFLSLSTDQVKYLLNDADNARQNLANEGADGRIVSGIWVVVEATLGEQFDSVGTLSVSDEGENVKLTASGGKHGTQTITLEPGATFAYRLAKVKDWNKGKTKVEEVEQDYMA